MQRLLASLMEANRLDFLLLTLSGLALGASFLAGAMLPVDPAWIAVVLCGAPIVKGAAEGLITEFDIKADVLVSLALIAAVAIGEVFAAGEIAFIMQIGALLEERTVAKARAGIERLVRLTPRTARVVEGGAERTVPADEVRVGQVLRVLPGEAVAVDGVILSGQTAIDQSVMTGESLPVDKEPGDEVFSGTVNQFGAFEMRAVKVGQDSSLQRMIRLVESADAGKARIVGVADRWATWIVAGALACAVGTWLVTGEVIRAVTILVVFCPCALVLATPTAIMAAIGNSTRRGVLVRQGDALERLAGVRRLCLDKTGTLTHGRPQVAAVRSIAPGLEPQALLALAAAAELRSEHPLGRAVLAHYRATGPGAPREPQAFTMLPGRGVLATVDGAQVLAGNAALLADHGVALPPALAREAEDHVQEGATLIFVAMDGQAAGFIALADALREAAPAMVREAGALGLSTVLLTGDHEEAARHVAAQAGILELHARCLPEDKLALIDLYQQNGQPVAMVGDGVNDAPALRRAHVGIAMGGIGSDIAVDAADIALVGDDITAIPQTVALARRMMRTIHINMTMAMALNFVATALSMLGLMGPVAGALVHNVGSVLVVLNSTLLLRWAPRPARRARQPQAAPADAPLPAPAAVAARR
ncbi:heavy metal translocating P-type ATPase [Desulfocurvus vexinensis]|uniref:heavy metal translocating P-type ATPase n=1 Tax=Desulfocurvus vexinensis TaxID=399548 RepID=UPI0004B20EAE|nr:cation-translocating P-type ATPase [Desulfocurvus vexinensis]